VRVLKFWDRDDLWVASPRLTPHIFCGQRQFIDDKREDALLRGVVLAMASWWHAFIDWLRSLFWRTEMEVGIAVIVHL